MLKRRLPTCRPIVLGLWLVFATASCSKDKTAVLPEVAHVAQAATCPQIEDAPQLAMGKRVYARLCASCHQMDGRGLPGIFPPLAGHAPRLAQTDAGKAYLERLVLWGLSGPITVDGKIYQNVMPPQAQLVSDAEVASVLAYVMHAFDNCRSFSKPPVFAPEDVSKLRLTTDTGLGTFNLRKITAFTKAP